MGEDSRWTSHKEGERGTDRLKGVAEFVYTARVERDYKFEILVIAQVDCVGSGKGLWE